MQLKRATPKVQSLAFVSIAAFCAVVVLDLAAGHRLFPVQKINLRPFLDLTRVAQSAKRDRLFLAIDNEGQGRGIDLLHRSDLFSALFPGYPTQMAKDKKLWASYFSREMLPSAFLSRIEETENEELKVMYSWEGCLDIYKNYGADIIVLGSSEVFHAIMPDLLHDRLRISEIKNPRVLLCPTSMLPVSVVERFLEVVDRMNQKKPAIVLWGYSFWQSYSQSPVILGHAQTLMQKLSDYENLAPAIVQEDASTHFSFFENVKNVSFYNFLLSGKLSALFSKLSWDDLGFVKLENFKKREIKISKLEPELQKPQITPPTSLDIPDSYLRDEFLLKKTINELAIPSCSVIQNTTPKDCNAELAETELKRPLKIITKWGSDLFIYLTPVTSIQMKSGAVCFRPMAKEVLHQFESKKIHVLLDEMPDYGLTDIDFMKKLVRFNAWRFDENHVSISGAKKVTIHLTDWINREMVK